MLCHWLNSSKAHQGISLVAGANVQWVAAVLRRAQLTSHPFGMRMSALQQPDSCSTERTQGPMDSIDKRYL